MGPKTSFSPRHEDLSVIPYPGLPSFRYIPEEKKAHRILAIKNANVTEVLSHYHSAGAYLRVSMLLHTHNHCALLGAGTAPTATQMNRDNSDMYNSFLFILCNEPADRTSSRSALLLGQSGNLAPTCLCFVFGVKHFPGRVVRLVTKVTSYS